MKLSERLKKTRLAQGLTQAELAKRTNITQQSIQGIETGQSKGGRSIEKLADALDVSVAWLRFGEKTENLLDYVSCSMELSERLKKIRLAKGLTQEELAKRANVTQQYIQKIETGRAKGGKTIEKLAAVLDVPPEWLKFGKKVEVVPEKIPPVHYAPVLNWSIVSCDYSTKKSKLDEQTEYVPFKKTKCSPNTYALVNKGDFMESGQLGHKTFLAGEKLIINPDIVPNSGDYVIALVNESSEAVFKQYITDGPHQYLKPLNRQYPTITIDNKVKIIGVVIGRIDDEF